MVISPELMLASLTLFSQYFYFSWKNWVHETFSNQSGPLKAVWNKTRGLEYWLKTGKQQTDFKVTSLEWFPSFLAKWYESGASGNLISWLDISRHHYILSVSQDIISLHVLPRTPSCHQIILPPANEVWGRVIFSVACVKNSVHAGRGVCLSVCWETTPLTRHPPEQTPPQNRPPPDQAPPGADSPTPRSRPTPAQSMLGDAVNKRAVSIQLECNLVRTLFQRTWGWLWENRSLYPSSISTSEIST